jgi:predicted RNA-binding protein with RPS1 domain
MFRVGQQVQVYVMRVDRETKKIALSIRRAAPEQWEQLITRYQVGDVVPGVITKLVAFGAFARLPGPVEGLVHVSELVDRRIAHPQEVVEEGDVVPLKIVRIEHDRHRLGLSLNEARGEGEQKGWQFDQSGRVLALPAEAGEAFPGESSAMEPRLEGRRAEAARVAASPAPVAEREPGEGREAREPARVREPEPAPMTAMAAAMAQAQAELEARADQAGEPDSDS